MTRAEYGVTLLEVMIASAIAAVIAIGLTTVEGMRARTTEEIRRQAGLMEPERKNAALAAVHIAKSIETADRFNLDPATGVYQMRIPVCPTTPPLPACFDSGDNYEWRQYRLTGGELRLYRKLPWLPTNPACPTAQVLAREIAVLTIDEDPPPNANRVTYSVAWDNGPRDQVFQGNVMTRFRPTEGSPWGLATTDISPPPGACP
ncbi:MAG: prepilin-type N-terminal cleavage/methylation domain-containing protein [Candidatus Omnitrophica bacterium]|nr:prepilin-type N-terminal cleavage/methylation domain-containing protein [Candidatus Omnitrophota bacterium]